MIEKLEGIRHTGSGQFFLIAGPCVIENEKMPLEIAGKILSICDKLRIPFIFKASYRKANRSKLESFTGIGDREGLEILGAVRKELGIPVLTDIHSEQEAGMAAPYVDILQIPAFLSRQTSLLLAAARTGKAVNVKKGQFLSPASMRFAIDKVRSQDNQVVMLTERGTTFGYGDLVVDFRGLPTMQSFGVPVVLDVTHSLQQPNTSEGVSGGLPALIPMMARAGIAAGYDGLFIETHPEPSKALSDGSNMLALDKLSELLAQLVAIRNVLPGK